MKATPETGSKADSDMDYDKWEERRRYKRYASELGVRYREVTAPEDALAEGTVSNISRGGVFISTKTPLPTGTEIALKIQVVTPFGEEQQLEAKAKVMWISERAGEEGMGLTFSEIDRHTQFALLACAYRGEG